MNEWVVLFVGGGGLISGIIGFLTYRSNHKGSQVDWYDRAIEDNDRLREEKTRLENELIQTKSKVLQLRLIINKLRIENRELKKRLKKYLGGQNGNSIK